MVTLLARGAGVNFLLSMRLKPCPVTGDALLELGGQVAQFADLSQHGPMLRLIAPELLPDDLDHGGRGIGHWVAFSGVRSINFP